MANSRMGFLDTRGSYWDEESPDIQDYLDETYDEVANGLYIDEDGEFFTIDESSAEYNSSCDEWSDYENYLDPQEVADFVRKLAKELKEAQDERR